MKSFLITLPALILLISGCSTICDSGIELAIESSSQNTEKKIAWVIRSTSFLSPHQALVVSEVYEVPNFMELPKSMKDEQATSIRMRQFTILENVRGKWEICEIYDMEDRDSPELFLSIRKAIIDSSEVVYKRVLTYYLDPELAEVSEKSSKVYKVQTGDIEAVPMSGAGETVTIRINPDGKIYILSVVPARR